MAKKWTAQTFEEALESLRQRVAITRDQFDRLYAAARRKAFTVAAIESVELIEIIQRAIEEALEAGISGDEWREKVSEVVERAGWKDWGAEKRTARLDNVFRTNIMAAYGQGRLEQQSEMADIYPYARYHAIGDDRTRPEHAALDGTVAPLGSAFWAAHYPPWGYQCRCYAEPVAEHEVDPSQLERERKFPQESDFSSPAAGLTPDDLLDRLTPQQRSLAQSLIDISN